MEIKRGSFTAVTGESGCGKSTLTLKEIREQISYVPQEPYLYETTVAENIAYGRYGSSREDVIAAAKAANAHDFIIKLPHGYDTISGPRGNTRSDGQRQRIAIARAIIRNTPIIILDEATSALDNESEALVQEAVKALKGERTILMIAHRSSSIASADAVIQFSLSRAV
ncbi:MAG: ATP-binding cassette domain-containing protein [Hungatella sp.]|nr:ATP-binding cassette domain-containing protein [Hungatella sp.]